MLAYCVFAALICIVIANELGGMLCRLPKNSGYECGVTSSHSAFHFDADIGECIEFMFMGCGGNQNRFPTKADCMEGCRSLTLCGKGMPLMDFAGNIKRCDGDRVPCPGSHDCIGNGMTSVCCQKADRVCQSPVHGGTMCSVSPQTRYYYDAASKTCRSFAFSGCGGNENNFKTKGECTRFCSTEIICPRGDPHPDRYSINKMASCHENIHCPRNYTCTAKGGKKGACCPSRDFVCGTPIDTRNNCRRGMKESLWTFDHMKGDCKKVEQPTCDDDWNSFANQEQCVDYCVGTCPHGLETHFNPISGQPQLCNAKKNIGCPLGFECIKSSPFAAICCKTQPLCPSAESIALLKDADIVRCSPDRDDSCPEQYSCQQAKNLEHICCTRPLTCPSGMTALREDGGRPRICSIGVEGNCPPDHMCVQGDGLPISNGARNLCCKPEKKCIVPFVDLVTKRPKRCYPGDSTCPASTSCLAALEDNAAITNAIDVMFFCCHTVDVFTCSDGKMPLIDQSTNRPMKCLPSNPMSCPADLVCSTLMDSSHACCPNPTADQTCVEALVGEEEQPITCKDWSDHCSEGRCLRAADGLHYCCRVIPSTSHLYNPFVTKIPALPIIPSSIGTSRAPLIYHSPKTTVSYSISHHPSTIGLPTTIFGYSNQQVSQQPPLLHTIAALLSSRFLPNFSSQTNTLFSPPMPSHTSPPRKHSKPKFPATRPESGSARNNLRSRELLRRFHSPLGRRPFYLRGIKQIPLRRP